MRPLLGLAKARGLSKERLQEYLQRVQLDKLEDLSERLFEMLDLKEEKLPLLILISSKMKLKEAERRIYECFRRNKRPLLVVIAGDYEENEKLKKSLENSSRLLFNTIAYALPLTDRASLYALSLAYNILEGYNFENLTPVERRIFNWYNTYLQYEIINAIYALNMRYRHRGSDFIDSLKNSRGIIKDLERMRGKQVGSQQARMLYLNAAFPLNIEFLTEILVKLKEVRDALRRFLQVLSQEGAAKINVGMDSCEELKLEVDRVVDDVVFKNIRMLTEEPAIRFCRLVRELYDRVKEDVGVDQIERLGQLVLGDVPDRITIDEFYRLIWNGVNRIEQVIGINYPEISFTILSGIFKERSGMGISFHTPDMMHRFYEITTISHLLGKIIETLNELNEKFKKYDIDLSTNRHIQVMVESLRDLTSKVSELSNYSNKISEARGNYLNIPSCLLRIALFEGLRSDRRVKSEGILHTFISNMRELNEYIGWLRTTLEHIIGNLEAMSNRAETLQMKELTKALRKDLSEVLEKRGTLCDLCRQTDYMLRNVEKLARLYEECSDKYRELRERGERIVERLRILLRSIRELT